MHCNGALVLLPFVRCRRQKSESRSLPSPPPSPPPPAFAHANNACKQAANLCLHQEWCRAGEDVADPAFLFPHAYDVYLPGALQLFCCTCTALSGRSSFALLLRVLGLSIFQAQVVFPRLYEAGLETL